MAALARGLQRLEKEMEVNPKLSGDPLYLSRRMIVRSLTSRGSMREKSGPEACQLLLQHGEAVCKHEFIWLFCSNILYILEEVERGDHVEDAIDEYIPKTIGMKVCITDMRVNYENRGVQENLDKLPL